MKLWCGNCWGKEEIRQQSNTENQIVELQGLGIDAVSGATLTSNAILDGVADCVKQAGGDVEALKAVKPEVTAAEDEELTADVVVIGAGGALNAVDEGSEEALAREDSVDFHYQQTCEGGDKQGDPELVRKLVDEAYDGVEWLMDLGMEFQPGLFTVTGGMWERAHKPVKPEGSGFFKTYQAYMDKNEGITMKYETTAKHLIVEDGAVVGVECEGKTGNKVTVKANNGVVLATGGFGRNIEMREKYNEETKLWPTLDETIPSTNTTAITGDGIVMAEEIGTELVQMGNIQLLPLGDPQTGSLSGNIEHSVESRIFVNKEGNRFVNEGGRRDEMTLALFEQPDTTMYIVMNSDCYPTDDEVNNFNESVNSLVAAGRAYKADTLEELAEQIGVPAENLKASVEEYNRHCLGGVKINLNTEVIDTEGNVIPGLYAAGEVTGGIYGSNHLGGNALTDTVVFGRTAGANAAAYER